MAQEALKQMQWHVMTQAQYDALETKNSDDVYAIVDDKEDYSQTKLNKMIFNVMSVNTFNSLETKNPNEIYYVTGENEVIDHKSWTDGSQNSVTPAGFQDCGFRYYSISNTNFDAYDLSNLDSNNTELYNALMASKVYVNGKSTATQTVQELISANSFNAKYLITKTIIPKNDTIDLNSFYQFKYVIQSADSTVMQSIIMQAVFVDYDADGNVSYVRPVMTEYIDSTGLDLGLNFHSNLAVTTYAYYTAGYTAIMAVGIVTDQFICSECSFDIKAYNMPIFDQASSTVEAAKTDYESITSELTARGNTITSLNTQGQNLVSAYNKLADKYNTAGIIITEE